MVKQFGKQLIAILLVLIMMISVFGVSLVAADAAERDIAPVSVDFDTGIDELSAAYEVTHENSSYKGEGKWTKDGTTFTATVKGGSSSGCGSSNNYKTTCTLTITCTSVSERTLAFDYEDDEQGTVTFTGMEKPSNGDSPKLVMKNGDKLIIKIEMTGSTTTTVKLKNVTFQGPQTITTKFKAPTGGGTYTVDGETITTDTEKQKLTTQSYSLVASFDPNYYFVGWYINGSLYSTKLTIDKIFDETSTVEAHFAEDQFSKIPQRGAVVDDSLTVYDLADYYSHYEPDFKKAEGKWYSTAPSAADLGSYAGQESPDNVWINENFPNLDWNQSGTKVTTSKSGTAYGDGGTANAGSAKMNAKILRIHAKKDIKVSFNYSVTFNYDISNPRYDNQRQIAFFYSLKTSSTNPNPTLAQLKKGSEKGGNETGNSGDANYLGTFTDTINQGEYLYLYFYGFGVNQRLGSNTYDYSFSAEVSNLKVGQVVDSYDFQSGCIDGAGNMIGSGTVSINNTNYPVGSTGLTETIPDVLAEQNIDLEVTNVPSGYTHIGWRINDGTSTQDVFSTTHSINIRSNVSAYALFSPAITVTAGGDNGYGSATYTYKKLGASANMTAADQYIARSSDGKRWYKKLDDAFSDESIVVLCTNTIFEGDYTIPSGKTLSVPYSLTDEATSVVQIITGSTNNTQYVKATIKGNFTVSGNLVASGRQSLSSGKAYGPAGLIQLDGSLSVVSGGTFYAYSAVSGSGTIDVQNNGKVYELMELCDLRDPHGLAGMKTGSINKTVLPFNCFYIDTVLVPTTYEQGARLYAHYAISVTGLSSGTVPIIGPNDSSNKSLFMIESGSITKDYSTAEKKHRYSADPGSTIQTGSFAVSASALGMSIDMNTADKVLPLCSGYWIDIANGATLTLNSDFKLLPGAKLSVQEGGTLNIASGKKLVLYRANDYDYRSKGGSTGNKQGFTTNGYPKWFSYPTGVSTAAKDLGSAKLTVDGTINCQGGLYVTNQLNSTQTYSAAYSTAYPNGYNYLTGTGTIVVSNTPSNSSIYEEIEKHHEEALDYNAASSATVAITAVKGITDYTTASNDGQTNYNSLTKGTWYGWKNDSGVNVWTTSRPATLSYDANGGTGTAPDPVAKPVGETYTFTAAAANTFTAPANTNKVFTGWNTKADGSGTSYAAGDTFTISEDTTLYAQWAVPTYTVTWKNGDTTLKTDIVNDGENPKYTGIAPTKSSTTEKDYTFTGWNDGTTTYGKDATLPAVHADVTYTAQFDETPREYTITWKNGDQVLKSEPVAFGQTPIAPADPTKEKDSDYSYTFAGWNDGTQTYGKDAALPVVTGNVTYTAVFAKQALPQHSLTLKGEIGVNFYIPKDLVDDKANSTVKMSWGPEDKNDPNHGEATFAISGLTDNNENNKNVAFHQKIDEGSSTKNPLAKAKINGDYYQFTAFVAAKQMADEVTVTIYDGGKKLTDTYRVADYCYEVIANAEDAEGKSVYERMHAKRPEITEQKFTDLQNLCKAMLTYGAKAQDQFSYNNNNEGYADKGLTNYTYQYTCTADTFKSFYTDAYASGAGDMTYYGSSMQLEAETTYTVWLRYTNAGYKPPKATATVNGEEVPVDTIEVSGDYGAYHYVRYNILNLPANLLTENITVSYNGVEGARTYNAQTYFYIAMVSGNDTLKNTIASLYNYNQAAVKYFG